MGQDKYTVLNPLLIPLKPYFNIFFYAVLWHSYCLLSKKMYKRFTLMKTALFTFLVATLLFSISSCRKKDNPKRYTTANSMTMRYNGGYGPVADIRVYSLAGGTVLEDTSTPPDNIYDIDLGQEKYNQAAYVLTEVPGQLLKENGEEYGTGKRSDAGGVQLTADIKGVAYSWYFSEYTEEMPEYARVFADKLFSVKQTLAN